jgi:competence protein ComEC
VANLLLVPILGFVVLPLSMVLILVAPLSESLSAPLIDITSWLTRLCLDLNDWLAALPGASSIITTPTVAELAAYYVILITAALLLGLPGRATAEVPLFRTRRKALAVMALAVIFLAGDAAWLYRKLQNRDALRVTFLDVGHAGCTLVEFPGGYRMLVDGGGFHDDRFDVGRYVVAPFLWHERIGAIDTVVLTHPHPDHANGLSYILDNFDVKEVWTNGDEALVDWGSPLVEKMKQKGITPRILSAKAEPIDAGGVAIHILNPGKGPPPAEGLSDREINERSLVFHLRWGETAFLLPSDIGEPTESMLVARHKDLRSGILLAPHHGSPFSGSQPFLQAVRPGTVVVSTGRGVRDDVLERYRRTGAAIYRTDIHGAVRVTTDGRRYEVVPFKSP